MDNIKNYESYVKAKGYLAGLVLYMGSLSSAATALSSSSSSSAPK
jgi:hypothetical protein